MVALLCALMGACGAVRADPEPLLLEHDGRWLVRTPTQLNTLPPGFVEPYPVARVYGTFGDCRPGGRQHRGLDLGGIGEHAGLGSPVRALTRSRVTLIVRPEDDPARWGRRDSRRGTVERSGETLPRVLAVPSYGDVYFFTRDHGSAHTGVMVVTEAVGGVLDGHTIRYMHLGDPHPGLDVGVVLEAGQELGVMGGTAIMQSLPHVHIDIEDERGRRVDVAAFVGLSPDTRRCSRR